MMNYLEWEEMDPIELEGMNEDTPTGETSSHDENLIRLSDEGAAERANYRDHVANWMWAQHHG